MPVIQEPDLSERLHADDERVLEDVLRLFGPAVRAVLVRKFQGVLAGDEIDDVLSIGLFRLWTYRHRYDRRKGTLRVWFFRITDNAARDVLRLGWQKARRLEVAAPAGALAELPDPRAQPGDPPADDDGDVSALRMDLREILDTLPEAWRHILLADASTRDGTASSRLLAGELNIPASTVRVYRKRALDRIRVELERRGHSTP